MKRMAAVVVAAVFALGMAGCAGAPGAGAPGAGAPGAGAPGAGAPLAAQPWAAAEPVPWGIDLSTGQSPAVPIHADACSPGPSSSSTLQTEITSAEWRVHPQNQGLWVPSAVLLVCNASDQPLPAPRVKLTAATDVTGGGPATWINLPKLNPGEGAGPVRVFSLHGVPAARGALWQADGTRWPTWQLVVGTEQEPSLATAQVRRVLGPAVGREQTSSPAPEAQGGSAALPDPLPLPLMQAMAYGQVEFPGAGGKPVSVFLYAPDADYSLIDDPWCGGPTGAMQAQANHWGLYVSAGGADPERVADLGALEFPGGRSLKAAPAAKAGITFLMVEQYGSCAAPTWHLIHAYDRATGELYRPKIRRENGQVTDAAVNRYDLGDDGTLIDHYWSNGGDVGQHTVTYRWDARSRMWVFASHSREK